ncbi:hypothetical protein [Streptomyces fructofermentans]|uniref:Secreted protein n=1 Tax=Streptomyces fructofermentans TaxID=152141 RepID=A0A918K8K2_9ACTN|nr:hypothetical protein [Streptomyces fructofermentans]GGX54637.1 hypothetical protein GCM10010515_22430 [Streptomyces fructofermentans]
MAASAQLLLSALSKPPADLPADEPADEPVVDLPAEPDPYLCVFSAQGARAEAPLTSEPPLPDAAPLTSEPPLADAAPLTSEPSLLLAAPSDQGGPSSTGVGAGPDPSGV